MSHYHSSGSGFPEWDKGEEEMDLLVENRERLQLAR